MTKLVLFITCFLAFNVHASSGPIVSNGLKKIEIAMFQEVEEAFQKKDVATLRRVTNLLIKVFPESQYSDDALYWLGRLAVDEERYDEALFALDRLFKFYPKGDRLSAALVMKTVVYGKMGLWQEAEDLFKKRVD